VVSFREKLANSLKEAGFSLVSLENEGCIRVVASKDNIPYYAAFMPFQYEDILVNRIVSRILSNSQINWEERYHAAVNRL
jgi:hypothetical protein